MVKPLRAVLTITLFLWALTGLAYPLAMVGVGNLLFPRTAAGSLLYLHGQPVASALVGQAFEGNPDLFWGRPSATTSLATGRPDPDNPLNSGPSNLGPDSQTLVDHVRARIAAYLKSTPGLTVSQIPPSLVESSGSGLDPDISPEAALIQVPRVSRATGLSPQTLQRMIQKATRPPALGIFGRPRVNVVELNLALLERLSSQP